MNRKKQKTAAAAAAVPDAATGIKPAWSAPFRHVEKSDIRAIFSGRRRIL